MVTLLGYSLELVRRGETTLEEVGRMVLRIPGWNPSAEPALSAQ
jgi:type IV pilus assembly protein PilB